MNVLNQIIKHIEQELFYDVSLDKLSNELNYSKYYISKYFNTKLGISIPSYIKQRRLTEAVKLIDQGERQMSDIAFQCGFNSTSYFSKIFKEIYYMTPREYAKGGIYLTLLERVSVERTNQMKTINEINNHIFHNYNNYTSINDLFSTLDNVVLNKLDDVSVEYFALLPEEQGNCLYTCTLNLLSGEPDKSIIAHDKNTPNVIMDSLSKTDDTVYIECSNTKTNKTHTGKLIYIGKADYMIDMCRIEDTYINQMDHYIQEEPTQEDIDTMIKEVQNLFELRNNLQIKEYINRKDHIELVRLINDKVLLVYLINNKETFTIYDFLVDLNKKTIRYNCNSSFNHFETKGSLAWNQNTLEVRLNNKYFAKLLLGSGELYKLYNSPYAIEFKNNLRGLSSISFKAK